MDSDARDEGVVGSLGAGAGRSYLSKYLLTSRSSAESPGRLHHFHSNRSQHANSGSLSQTDSLQQPLLRIDDLSAVPPPPAQKRSALSHAFAPAAQTPTSSEPPTQSSTEDAQQNNGATPIATLDLLPSASLNHLIPETQSLLERRQSGADAGASVQQQQARAQQRGTYARSLLYGAINAVVTIPCMMSFAVIIFRPDTFQPYMVKLVKLVFLASAIHQLVFVCKSCLPFAVGQVQDVGLILLSAMASSVVQLCQAAGCSEAAAVSTTLFTLSASTAAVGLLVALVAKLKVARLVQYVPLPVVGGYLAYVGYFCIAAGVSLAAGVDIAGVETWGNLFKSWSTLLHLLPAIAATSLFVIVSNRFNHPAALPAVLVAVPLVFFAVLLCFRIDFADAQATGWLPPAQPQVGEFWKMWDVFLPKDIYWPALWHQAPTAFGLFVLVAFGSSMDIAAIQTDLSYDIDFDAELATVGISNAAAGLVGAGATGSYIFSQTIFSHRMGVTSRLNGVVITAAEFAIVVLPVSIIQYFPNFFLGALMIWFGYDILMDWLVHSWHSVMVAEYTLIWLTFAAIMALSSILPLEGMQLGILVGILMCTVYFAVSYAQLQVRAFSVVASRSGAVRTYEQRAILDLFVGNVMAVGLAGYIFFGSSVQISERVRRVAQVLLEYQPSDLEDVPSSSAPAAPHTLIKILTQAHVRSAHDGKAAAQHQNAPHDESQHDAANTACSDAVELSPAYALLQRSMKAKAKQAVLSAPKFLILDFRGVTNIDATAARTFSKMARGLSSMGVTLVITHPPPSRPAVRRVLENNGIIDKGEEGGDKAGHHSSARCRAFASMDAGLLWCEDALLATAVSYGLCSPPVTSMSLADVLRAHLVFMDRPLPAPYPELGDRLARFVSQRSIAADDVLFRVGEAATEFGIILRGDVQCDIDYTRFTAWGREVARALPTDIATHASTRTLHYGPGSLVGDLDFFLQRPWSFTCRCPCGATVAVVSQSSWQAMAVEDGELLSLLQSVLIRNAMLTSSHALEALERSGS